ncbi:MAG: EAL domain-containing protein [Clostridia bacterium]|nr:EAL domain-containing protein [Clostridia bacterium]
MIELNFELSSIVLYISCLMFCFISRGRLYRSSGSLLSRLTNQHFLYICLLVFSVIPCICSYAAESLQVNAPSSRRTLLICLHMGYFIFHTFVPMFYTLYIMSINGSMINRTPGFFIRFFLPVALCMTAIFLAPFNHLVFRLDEQQQYHRGPLIFVLYLSAAYYISLGTYYFLKNRRALRLSTVNAIIFLTLLSIIGILIQLFWPRIIIETFAEALAFSGFLLTLEDTERNIDPLTGIYHRIVFDEENKKQMLAGRQYSVIHIHLDNLGLLSRILSVKSSDIILSEVAAWLLSFNRRENVFSYHTEDFLVIVPEQDEQPAYDLAELILERFQSPWKLENLQANINAIISVLHVPNDAATAQELDRLLEIAASHHTHESILLTPDDIEQFKRDLLIERLLDKAIENKSIDVFYQPIWSSESNTIVAAEGLARLIDPEYGFIPPDEFIPIAEKNGMIMALGSLVFEKICAFIEANPLAKLGMSYIEVNLSTYQFLQDHLEQHLLNIMNRHHVTVDMVNLEITESMADDAAPFIEGTMQNMLKSGFTFSLDDFGTAYSNLQRLITGNYINIKIDKSILWDAGQNEGTRQILEYLIRIIRANGLNTIQEGVETREQLEQISEYGCNMVQGYYFSKPLREQAFVDFVREFNHID